MKSLNYYENNQNVAQRHKVIKHCQRDGSDRLDWCKVATDLQLLKNVLSANCSRMRSAYSQSLPRLHPVQGCLTTSLPCRRRPILKLLKSSPAPKQICFGPYVLGLVINVLGQQDTRWKAERPELMSQLVCYQACIKGIQLIRRMRNKCCSMSLRDLTLPSYNHISSVIPPWVSSSHWSPLSSQDRLSSFSPTAFVPATPFIWFFIHHSFGIYFISSIVLSIVFSELVPFPFC